MDVIFIKGLVISSVIGVYTWERCCFQKLVFDLDIGYYNSNKIDVYDVINIDNCYLDYQKISNFVNILVMRNHFFLVESVAEFVATELMLKFNVPWVRVKVSKIGAISGNIDVGVVIERGSQAS